MKVLSFILLITLTLSFKFSTSIEKPKEEEVLEMGMKMPMKGFGGSHRPGERHDGHEGFGGPGERHGGHEGFGGPRERHGRHGRRDEKQNGIWVSEEQGGMTEGGEIDDQREMTEGQRFDKQEDIPKGPDRHHGRKRRKPHVWERREGDEENERPPYRHRNWRDNNSTYFKGEREDRFGRIRRRFGRRRI